MKEKPNIKNQLTKINITNMTKVSVFGQQPTETKELKKIEFVKFIGSDESIESADCTPVDYQNVTLISRKYSSGGLDLIFAFDSHQNNGTIYLGHWNDGVV